MPKYKFKANSHILSLLGDELIGSDSLAIFELVKNAYDADAELVTINLNDLNTPNQSIVIEDDGIGMTLKTLENVWLEIGTDFKRGKKRKISKKFNRISLGEKGVGRLAVHKLGKSITLETQPLLGNHSFRITLNWQELMDKYEFINQAEVEIQQLNESLFLKHQGTRVIIQNLNKKTWEKRDLKELAKKVNSIKSPFKRIKGNFDVVIKANGFQEWIDEVKSVDEILKDHIYYFDFTIKKDIRTEFANLTWSYKYSPPKNFKLKKKEVYYPDKSKTKVKDYNFYNVFEINAKEDNGIYENNQKHLKNKDLDGIGEITGKFYVFNLLSVVLKSFGQTQVIKNYIKENCGIKIFRDGIRVYNYGESNDDWLGLDLGRVQRLGGHFSKNTVIGSIEISLEGSEKFLKEKTNREGFDENETFKRFKDICIRIFSLLEVTALSDREALRNYLEGLKPTKVTLPETIIQITEKLKTKNLDKEIAPLLKRVEKDYNDMRDVMLSSGMTGLNLGLVFHEVDRELKFINSDLINKVEISTIIQKVKNLIHLLEGFSPILRQNKNIEIQASKLVEQVVQINFPRFKYHNIIFNSPLLTGDNKDFKIKGPGNLLISALSNIFDNSIYWVSSKKELEGKTFEPSIYIVSDIETFKGPAIIIADNGNGFTLEPEDLVMPYRTTKPGGMGLGLYFVNMVMEMIGGNLFFPDQKEVNVPEQYNGAIIALVFPD